MQVVNDLIEHFANDLMIKSLKLLLKKYYTNLETADASVICKLNTYLKAGMLFQDLKENWSINYLEMIGSLILQKYNTQEVLQLADKINSDQFKLERLVKIASTGEFNWAMQHTGFTDEQIRLLWNAKCAGLNVEALGLDNINLKSEELESAIQQQQQKQSLQQLESF